MIKVEKIKTNILADISPLDKEKNSADLSGSGWTRQEEASLDSPKITYPCTWSFKIIGSDAAQITEAVVALLEAFAYQFSESRHSRTGKYTSFHLAVQVKNEAERLAIFNGLKRIPSVKVIL